VGAVGTEGDADSGEESADCDPASGN